MRREHRDVRLGRSIFFWLGWRFGRPSAPGGCACGAVALWLLSSACPWRWRAERLFGLDLNIRTSIFAEMQDFRRIGAACRLGRATRSVVQIALKNPEGLTRLNPDANRRRPELSAASHIGSPTAIFKRLDSLIFVPYMFFVRFLFQLRRMFELRRIESRPAGYS